MPTATDTTREFRETIGMFATGVTVLTAGDPTDVHAMTAIACDLTDMHDGGDHWIVVGRVTALHRSGSPRPPLIFFGGDYRRLQRSRR